MGVGGDWTALDDHVVFDNVPEITRIFKKKRNFNEISRHATGSRGQTCVVRNTRFIVKDPEKESKTERSYLKFIDY